MKSSETSDTSKDEEPAMTENRFEKMWRKLEEDVKLLQAYDHRSISAFTLASRMFYLEQKLFPPSDAMLEEE